MGDLGLIAQIDERIRLALAGDTILATVTSIDGTSVYVQRLRSGTGPEGPYASAAGAVGFLNVGDVVQLKDMRLGSPVVGYPLEGAARANMLQIVGSDTRTVGTTSVSSYEELLRVDGLAIPTTARFDINLFVEVLVTGSPGAAEKEMLLVFNDAVTVTVTLTNTAATFWLPATGSTARHGLSTGGRSLLILTAADNSPNALAGVEQITSISIEARTNDTEQGNDEVLVSDLLVFS